MFKFTAEIISLHLIYLENNSIGETIASSNLVKERTKVILRFSL